LRRDGVDVEAVGFAALVAVCVDARERTVGPEADTLPIVSVDGEWTTAAGLLALMTVDGVGPAKALAVARGEQPAEALADRTMLVEERERANAQMSTRAAAGVLTLGFFDEAFPAVLRGIPSAPAVLYWRGHPEAWSRPALAVVGTRQPTAFGISVTRTLTQAAASRGFVIVSGLAPGIDMVAHEAALDVGARTVAVLGSGLDMASASAYGQAALARRIVHGGGALISEQPFGVSPSDRTLVARNRLQTGLSDAILVGQSGVQGGTLHTVRYAAEQGRPVYCPVPHEPAEASAGLRVLLDEPARRLPELLPAWRHAGPLAARLGDRPLARPVHAEGTAAWLTELGGLPAEHPSDATDLDRQMTLGEAAPGSRR